MRKQYSIFLISNKPERYAKIQESLLPELLYFFDGSDVKNFSELVNRCVESSKTEIVILVSDKVRPKQEHIQKIIFLLEKGYGFVGLYRFAIFGFKKELLRQIGMFDERYLEGGFEDFDFILRLIKADISMYITEEVEYHRAPSSWNYSMAIRHWNVKWKHEWKPELTDIVYEKTMEEETYNYNLGPSVPTVFLPCKQYSYISGDDYEIKMISSFFYATIKGINENASNSELSQ